ncbi:hypothetical protein Q5P01_008313 [Channa striata]|uniref:Uncharacterized protein n=1 Tax=Channa striata TaxID=64152 RepID=A0AA88N8D0_CHASR|nr:hypothetical protein Q5P01_008313 [Channa striata]
MSRPRTNTQSLHAVFRELRLPDATGRDVTTTRPASCDVACDWPPPLSVTADRQPSPPCCHCRRLQEEYSFITHMETEENGQEPVQTW